MVITPTGSVESAEMVVAEPWSMASADWIVTRLDIRKASGKPWQGVAETTKPYALLANLEWDDRANAKHSWPVRVAVSAMPKPNGKPGDVPSLGFAGQLDVTATRGPWVSGTLSVAGAGKETSKWHSLGQVELRPGKDGQQAIIELHGARLDLAYSGGDDKAVLTLADLLPGLGTKMDMQGVVVIQTRMAWGVLRVSCLGCAWISIMPICAWRGIHGAACKVAWPSIAWIPWSARGLRICVSIPWKAPLA